MKIRVIRVIRGKVLSLFPQIRVHPRKSAVRIFFALFASFAVKVVPLFLTVCLHPHCLPASTAPALSVPDKSIIYGLALPLLFIPAGGHHDAHSLREQSKPNPEKPGSHVAHLGPQHWLDGTALSLAGCALRTRGSGLRRHPLARSRFFFSRPQPLRKHS